jgi:hypothetical protein
LDEPTSSAAINPVRVCNVRIPLGFDPFIRVRTISPMGPFYSLRAL